MNEITRNNKNDSLTKRSLNNCLGSKANIVKKRKNKKKGK